MEKLRPGDPEHIGPYEVIARLGAGGMGVVFLGTKGADRVAIKVVRSTFLDDPSLKTRFVREIETLKKVESPYVAKFLDSSVEGEIAWHAVEFVNGPTLKELIDSNGPMGEGAWLTFAGQLRQALDSVHRLGVVHRDIKPANIIMSETGPKLIDFGISQDSEATSITSTGAVAGSPAWLAPEQLTGEVLSPASDLFSAGSVLLFAATGRSPWGQETTMSVPVVYQKILSGNVDFSGLTTSQHKLVERLLDLNPEARSFDESKTPGISAQTRTRQVPSSATQQTTRARPKRRPKVVAWVVTAVVMLLGGGGGGLWWYFGSSVPLEPKTVAVEEGQAEEGQAEEVSSYVPPAEYWFPSLDQSILAFYQGDNDELIVELHGGSNGFPFESLEDKAAASAVVAFPYKFANESDLPPQECQNLQMTSDLSRDILQGVCPGGEQFFRALGNAYGSERITFEISMPNTPTFFLYFRWEDLGTIHRQVYNAQFGASEISFRTVDGQAKIFGPGNVEYMGIQNWAEAPIGFG